MIVEDVTLASTIAARLRADADTLRASFGEAREQHVRWCAIDDLLPDHLWRQAFRDLPPLGEMMRLKSRHERKYVSAQLNKLKPSLQKLVLAFNDAEVADVVARIMSTPRLETDRSLYNGGVTIMLPGDYMRPHLDNSHNFDRSRRRDVVLLYYISDYWAEDYDGALEAWSDNFQRCDRIEYRANRLVIMETTDWSWHSVRPILGTLPRANIIAYFYAPNDVVSKPRLTHFTAWPGRAADAWLCEAEFQLRTLADKVGLRKLKPNRHVYIAPSPPTF